MKTYMKPTIFFLFFSMFMHSQSKSITEKEVLDSLDHSNQRSYYTSFISLKYLGGPCLVDSRLNILKSENNEWAIAIEKLIYNPHSGYIELEIYYYGNCLINLEQYNGKISNVITTYPIDNKNYDTTIDGEVLKPDAKLWLVRGQKVALVHNKSAYKKANIEFEGLHPGKIDIEKAARLVIIKHSDLFRATDDELYKCIPLNLKKILTLNEWYHKDYDKPILTPSDDEIRKGYEFNKTSMQQHGMSLDDLLKLMKVRNEESKKLNEENYTNNRPSAYETWQMIAKVIATGDVSFYKPTLKPNTHWSNWPDSGSL